MHAAAGSVPCSDDMAGPPDTGAQIQAQVDGQSEFMLHEPVVTCSHVFHLRETHVVPCLQMSGIAIGGNVQPASLSHVGIGGFGSAEQGMRSAVA